MKNKFNINDEVFLVFITKIIICKVNSIYIKDNTIWYKLVANDFEYDTNEDDCFESLEKAQEEYNRRNKENEL